MQLPQWSTQVRYSLLIFTPAELCLGTREGWAPMLPQLLSVSSWAYASSSKLSMIFLLSFSCWCVLVRGIWLSSVACGLNFLCYLAWCQEDKNDWLALPFTELDKRMGRTVNLRTDIGLSSHWLNVGKWICLFGGCSRNLNRKRDVSMVSWQHPAEWHIHMQLPKSDHILHTTCCASWGGVDHLLSLLHSCGLRQQCDVWCITSVGLSMYPTWQTSWLSHAGILHSARMGPCQVSQGSVLGKGGFGGFSLVRCKSVMLETYRKANWGGMELGRGANLPKT